MGFFSEYREINRLLKEKQAVVFYAESRHYYPYFEKLISGLLESGDIPVCYITSDKMDPLLQQAPSGMRVVYCKWMLGYLFRQLRADVLVMTMPDLGNYFLKPSAGVGRYVYVFHAAVSTHLQYRKHAFDNYDIIFCTGEYQVKEIRKAEELYQLPAKQLVSYGYPLFNRLRQEQKTATAGTKPVVLIAPSWFSGCIFETCIEELLGKLSKLNCTVLVRSHPEYEKRYPARFRQIKKMMAAYPGMQVDTKTDVIESILAADILITDRSGIAFEFSFGAGKPVLFIDTVLKETNPDWKLTGLEPVENKYRSLMGISVSPAQLDQLPGIMEELKKFGEGFSGRIRAAGETIFFNGENSYKEGVSCIRELAAKS